LGTAAWSAGLLSRCWPCLGACGGDVGDAWAGADAAPGAPSIARRREFSESEGKLGRKQLLKQFIPPRMGTDTSIVEWPIKPASSTVSCIFKKRPLTISLAFLGTLEPSRSSKKGIRSPHWAFRGILSKARYFSPYLMVTGTAP
jgi:hypothetical protein